MKTNITIRSLALWTILSIIVVGCDTNNNTDPKLEAIPITQTEFEGYTVELLSDANLATGFNQLYWRISKDGDPVHVDNFSALPVMHMTMMSHSCPHTSPDELMEYDHVYGSTAHFIMASGDMGYWEYQISFTTLTEEQIEGVIEIDVASSWRLNSTQGKNGERYYISWQQPQTPKTGNQDWVFSVYKRENMMSFPAVNDAELVVYPYMDMGGGEGHSTSYVTPMHQENGYYKGSINYSMSGVWTTQAQVITPTDTSGTVIFEYNVVAR